MTETRFSSTTLDNGLSLVFESIPRLSSTAVGYLVRTGSRDEPRRIAGMSHYLEHMCFKGTAKRTWEQINRDVDELGALWNAFTWWEGTAYFHWVQHARAPESIEILSDMMRPTLDEGEFKMEKKVILEEIAMYNDNPSALIMDHLIAQAFGEHPLGTSVLGSSESVTAIGHADMQGYFERRYSPNNMVFLATGRIEADRLTAAVAEHTARWTSGEAGREQEPPPFERAARVMHRPEVTREHLAMAWPAPEAGSEWEAAAVVLAAYLGDAENSSLYWSVRQKGLVDSIYASHYSFIDSGFMYVYASSAPEKSSEVLGIVKAECARLHDEIDEQALARARVKEAAACVSQGENGLNRWMQLIDRQNAQKPLQSIQEAIAEIDAVTPGKIRAYLERFGLTGQPAMVALGPLEEAP